MNYFWERLDVKEFFINRKLDVGLLFLGIVLGVFFGWNPFEIVLFLVFIWSILGPIQSKWLALPALAFFFLTPVLLLLGYDEQAEAYAIYAYYFLVMMVIRAIIEIRKEGEKA